MKKIDIPKTNKLLKTCKGLKETADIPEDKIAEILREPTHDDTQTKLF